MSELRVEYLPISELVYYVKNPRKNDAAVGAVAKSIEEFGFKVPILIDDNNEIIAGHTRLKAAQQLELEKVPVIRVSDLSPEQVKAFRIADNKLGEISEWDMDILFEELTDLRECGFDIELTGFSDITLDGFAETSEGSSIDVDSFLTDEDKPDKKPKLITCPHCGESFVPGEDA